MVVESSVIIKLTSGLHARPASTFVQIANRYACDISIRKKEKTANAKSILGVLALAATKGSEVFLIADGPDEQKAIDELTEFLAEDKD